MNQNGDSGQQVLNGIQPEEAMDGKAKKILRVRYQYSRYAFALNKLMNTEIEIWKPPFSYGSTRDVVCIVKIRCVTKQGICGWRHISSIVSICKDFIFGARIYYVQPLLQSPAIQQCHAYGTAPCTACRRRVSQQHMKSGQRRGKWCVCWTD